MGGSFLPVSYGRLLLLSIVSPNELLPVKMLPLAKFLALIAEMICASFVGTDLPPTTASSSSIESSVLLLMFIPLELPERTIPSRRRDAAKWKCVHLARDLDH